MIKNKDYKELTRMIALRSSCKVQVGAIIYDSYGIFSWGWNHAGPTGLGMHAEVHAIKRANPTRLIQATILVYAIRKNRVIISQPCFNCTKRIEKFNLRAIFYNQGWVSGYAIQTQWKYSNPEL